jgi:UDPglucose 6-dehydrogenase
MSSNYKIGIVGGGFVGSATAMLACDKIDVIIYDRDLTRCKPSSVKKEDLLSCDVIFVCVPTPSFASGGCNTNIVEGCIQEMKELGVRNIVLRSTVPPGTSERLDVMFMPEFLTEVNWPKDFFNCLTWVFGVRNEDEKKLLADIMATAKSCGVISSDTCMFVSSKEAELIKYTRNNFLAVKIGFFNEIYRLCEAIGADYGKVREGVAVDSRIGQSHSGVPGYDGHYGFGGTCLPKDTSALAKFMDENDVPCYIIKAAVERNKKVDRPERDWEKDPRAFTS